MYLNITKYNIKEVIVDKIIDKIIHRKEKCIFPNILSNISFAVSGIE